MPSARDLAGPAVARALDRPAGIELAGVGLRHAGHAGAALGGRAAVGLALAPSAGCRTARRAQATFQHGSGWQWPATQRCPSLHLPGTQRSLQAPSSQYWPIGAGHVQALVVLAAPADADLRRRAGQRRIVAVDAAAAATQVFGHRADDARAEVDAHAGALVAALAGRADHALAALRDAELVHALVAGGQGNSPPLHCSDALAVAAAEAGRALRRRCRSCRRSRCPCRRRPRGVGRTQPSHTQAHRPAADHVAGLAVLPERRSAPGSAPGQRHGRPVRGRCRCR